MAAADAGGTDAAPPAAPQTTVLAYHDGSLPVGEAAAAARGPGAGGPAAPRPLPAALVLESEITVTQPGPLMLALAGPADARWFLDGRPLEVAGPRAEVPVTLPQGRHAVQVRVKVPAASSATETGAEPAVRVELRKPAGSGVQVE